MSTLGSSFPDDLAAYVEEAVASGKYTSEEQLLCDAVRLLQRRDKRLAELRAELKPAIDELDRGEGEVLNMDEIRARVREQLTEDGRSF